MFSKSDKKMVYIQIFERWFIDKIMKQNVQRDLIFAHFSSYLASILKESHTPDSDKNALCPR